MNEVWIPELNIFVVGFMFKFGWLLLIILFKLYIMKLTKELEEQIEKIFENSEPEELIKDLVENFGFELVNE